MEKRQSRIGKHIDFLVNAFRKTENKYQSATRKDTFEDKHLNNLARDYRRINTCCKKLMQAHTDYFNDMSNGHIKAGDIPEVRPEFLMAKIHKLSGILLSKEHYFKPKKLEQPEKSAPQP